MSSTHLFRVFLQPFCLLVQLGAVLFFVLNVVVLHGVQHAVLVADNLIHVLQGILAVLALGDSLFVEAVGSLDESM